MGVKTNYFRLGLFVVAAIAAAIASILILLGPSLGKRASKFIKGGRINSVRDPLKISNERLDHGDGFLEIFVDI